ncbi:hypothetical protein HZC32_00915 [Candidatus Woesearchaeota archaeon]|nr:hypothetical protein [Candidatus Woesearchaeota archaeon]
MKKFEELTELRGYIEKLNIRKPFPCPYLRVLPEELGYEYWEKNYGELSSEKSCKVYPEGELICLPQILENHRCVIRTGEIKINELGELEVKAYCGWNGSKFKLRLDDFEPKQNFEPEQREDDLSDKTNVIPFKLKRNPF